MRSVLTSFLDAIAVVVLAAGAGIAVMDWRLGIAVLVAGIVLLLGSLVAVHATAPAERSRPRR